MVERPRLQAGKALRFRIRHLPRALAAAGTARKYNDKRASEKPNPHALPFYMCALIHSRMCCS